MKKYSKIYFTGVLVLLLTGGVLWFVMPVKTFSAMENRYLTVWPELDVAGIRSGEVQEKFVNAANDQFIFRDFWMKTATKVQKGLGFRDANGVYFGKDQFYLEKVLNSDVSEKRYQRNVGFVDTFAKKSQLDVSLLLVPTDGCIYSDKLPKHGVYYDAQARYEEGKELFENGTFLEIADRLMEQKKDKQLYFRTDHHWTTQGAYVAYCAYMEQLGKTPLPYEDFQPESKSESFYGTLYSKAPVDIKPDSLIVPQNIPDCQVSCDTDIRDSIYDMAKLKEKDKYAVYFGGNYGIVEIENKDLKDGDTLILIKDSYANSFVPYLINHYKKIVMLDLRYFNESVNEKLKEEKPEQVLVLYEMSRFAQDSNLYKLMR